LHRRLCGHAVLEAGAAAAAAAARPPAHTRWQQLQLDNPAGLLVICLPPLLHCCYAVSQAAARGSEPEYAVMVDAAVAAACKGYSKSAADLPTPVPAHQAGSAPSAATIDLAIDCLSIELGKRILKIVPGYVSTEVCGETGANRWRNLEAPGGSSSNGLYHACIDIVRLCTAG
jgi:hypothetical protein